MRGGRPIITEAYIHELNKSGLPGKPIICRAYQQARPIRDCSAVKPKGKCIHAFYITDSRRHLIGIEVTGVRVTVKTHTLSICFDSQR